MTRESINPIIPPLKDLESAFHQKKDKKVNNSTSTFEVDTFEHFEKTPSNKGTGYEPEIEHDLEEDIHSDIEEMSGIVDMTMEEYKKRMHMDNGSGLVPPEILATANFKLKGHILSMLKDILFSEED